MNAATRLSTFTHDGLTFDVIDEGPIAGPVIVALHGFPERATMWSEIIPKLTDAGFRVLAPDQRGYSPGARPIGVRNYALDKLAGDILALADQAGVSTFHVLGHDWGAAVAWQLAGNHGERVRTASVLSVPHPRAFRDAMPRGQILHSWYMLVFQIPRLPEWLFSFNDRESFQKFGKKWMKVSDRLAERIRELFSEPGATTATVNWYRAMRYSLRSPARAVRVPTLFIWSDEDSAVTRAAADLNRKYVKAPYRFEVFEGVSHWIAEERPNETAALVLEHIAEHSS
ncbi:alpha/beta fold hydrolase [Mycobacteroides salmoniphilum]|uniref:Haloacetate dehalogenase H-1 n=1 Tax=Mycobacteroides salmoniphilum TaxID=404941 RepID=A0A4R8SRF7_9MYCO|nr:alpha/beta fold hydrolase [Mycobacteroides salmoniphilum]TDZ96898.1 Haloacetate dehalogenase H-1 [Mycobacteroides salmoniphilum]TEA02422.1 Haloacetate dehalogenase H-1 [Mycobacteroides salmoniphilum]